MSQPPTKLHILFLCTGNSCRSQMAEGWLRVLRPDAAVAYSAGTDPHGQNPAAVQVMAEAGVDISTQESQHIDRFANTLLDLVVTVCDHAAENCPQFPGRTVVHHHAFDDPPRLARDAASPEAALDCYRRVRDQIRAFVAETDFAALIAQGVDTAKQKNGVNEGT